MTFKSSTYTRRLFSNAAVEILGHSSWVSRSEFPGVKLMMDCNATGRAPRWRHIHTHMVSVWARGREGRGTREETCQGQVRSIPRVPHAGAAAGELAYWGLGNTYNILQPRHRVNKIEKLEKNIFTYTEKYRANAVFSIQR